MLSMRLEPLWFNACQAHDVRFSLYMFHSEQIVSQENSKGIHSFYSYQKVFSLSYSFAYIQNTSLIFVKEEKENEST